MKCIFFAKTFGFIFECMCLRDLRAYSQALGSSIEYYHDRYDLKADFVLHLHNGRYALIECKLGSREIEKGAEHLLELRNLVRQYNEKEKQMLIREPDLLIVLTGGNMAFTRDDGVKVIPLGCLKTKNYINKYSKIFLLLRLPYSKIIITFVINMKKDGVIIVSGGMDSITLLYDKQDEIALGISFDYGSNHNAKEIPYAAMHCKKLGIEHISIPLDFMHKYFKSSLLEGADAIPEGHYSDSNMKSTVVPFRNGIMLAIACGIAESRNLHKIFIANHAGDHAIYPDCRKDFIDAMSKATYNGTYENIIVDAPYTNITKSEIATIGKRLGIDYSQTWSCYKGGDKHCGKCGTCIERKEALRDAGIEDNTGYEQ